jgi:hypothetical protein
VAEDEEVVVVEGEEGHLLAAALGSMGFSVSIHATEPTRREDAGLVLAVELGPLVGAAVARARASVLFLLVVMASMARGFEVSGGRGFVVAVEICGAGGTESRGEGSVSRSLRVGRGSRGER